MDRQAEIVKIMRGCEPHFVGHPREMVLTALWRCMAAMLGPAKPETRENALREMPIAIRNILKEMDRMMAVDPTLKFFEDDRLNKREK